MFMLYYWISLDQIYILNKWTSELAHDSDLARNLLNHDFFWGPGIIAYMNPG